MVSNASVYAQYTYMQCVVAAAQIVMVGPTVQGVVVVHSKPLPWRKFSPRLKAREVDPETNHRSEPKLKHFEI